MSGHVKAILLIVSALAVLVAPLTAIGLDAAPSQGSGEPAAGEITVYGYVTNLSDQEENTPLQNVTVTLYSGAGNRIVEVGDPCSTDETGRFSFTFDYTPGVPYYLTFEYPGYAVRSLPDLNMSMESDGYISFQLRTDMADSDGDYALTDTANSMHAIVMAITTGYVYGTVQGVLDEEEFALGGATVTIVSENGQSYSAQTNGSGYFSIECPYGTYVMTVECSGFQTSEKMDVESGLNAPYRVTLQQNTSDVFMGMDSAHSLMLVAITILVLLLLIVFGIRARSMRTGSESVLVNDLEDLGKDEDEIRRP